MYMTDAIRVQVPGMPFSDYSHVCYKRLLELEGSGTQELGKFSPESVASKRSTPVVS